MFDDMSEKTMIVLIITVGLVVTFQFASDVGIERAKLDVERLSYNSLFIQIVRLSRKSFTVMEDYYG